MITRSRIQINKLLSKRKHLILLTIIGLAIIPIFISCSNNSIDTKEQIEEPYDYFYETSKPFVRWWWFASMVEEDNIRHQLNWVKENNFGGVEIAWVYPLNARNNSRDTSYTPRQEWLSPEWVEIVTFTKQYCDSIGLGCDFTFGTGWPFGDTYVPLENATKNYNEKDDEHKKTYYTVSWENPRKGYIIDHLDKNAFLQYAEKMGNALKPALGGNRSGLFVDSWEVETRKLWTNGFGEKFIETYGYDIQPFMDSIYDEKYADQHYDYIKLVADYVLTQFYIPFNDKCNSLGAFSRAQCSGAPVDIINAYASVDVPESEAMLYEPNFSRIPASAAALSAKREITSETFTCAYGFPKRHKNGEIDVKYRGQEKAGDLKLIADALFANGVNQIIWHGMPTNTIGVDSNRFYATVHVGAEGNLSKDLKEFNNYMAKVSSFLKKGVTYSDVAVYIPLEDAWMGQEMDSPNPQMPWAWGEYELRNVVTPEELKGYHPLWINADFLKKGTLENNLLIIGDCSFSSLYIDVNYLDIIALKTIFNLAKNNFPICIKHIPLQAGKNKSDEYLQMIEDLLQQENVSSEFTDIAQNKPLVHGDNLADFWCKLEDDKYYIFFANPNAQNLELPLEYGVADNLSVVSKTVTINTNEYSSEIELVFEPNQSLLIIVEDKEAKFENIEYYCK